MYMPYRGRVLFVASQGGPPKNPVWYNNLVAHPDIEVRHRRERMRLRARLATSEESLRCGNFATILPAVRRLSRPHRRDIPIFVCEPRA